MKDQNDPILNIINANTNSFRTGVEIAERNNSRRTEQLINSLSWALKYVRFALPLPDGVDAEKFAMEYNKASRLLKAFDVPDEELAACPPNGSMVQPEPQDTDLRASGVHFKDQYPHSRNALIICEGCHVEYCSCGHHKFHHLGDGMCRRYECSCSKFVAQCG